MPPKKRADQPQPAALPANPDRRLREAKPPKKLLRPRTVSPSQELLSEIKRSLTEAKMKFSLAKVSDVGYTRISEASGAGAAEKFAAMLGTQIAQRLRDDDIVGYLGNGYFVVYLPETGSKESRVVMERLCKQLCEPSNNLNLADQQANLIFKTTTLNTSLSKSEKNPKNNTVILTEQLSKIFAAIEVSLDSNESLQILPPEPSHVFSKANSLNSSAEIWAKRYEIEDPFWMDGSKTSQSVAGDRWQDNAKVLLKKFSVENGNDSNSRITTLLSLIQQSKIALLPEILDYAIANTTGCIAIKFADHNVVIEDSAKFTTEKQLVEFLSKACEMLLFLDNLTPPIPLPNLGSFRILLNESDTVIGLENIEDYLLNAIQKVRVNEDEQIKESRAASIKTLTSMISAGSHAKSKKGFEETFEILAGYTKNARYESILSKARASLKRHSEKLKRQQLLSKSNPENI